MSRRILAVVAFAFVLGTVQAAHADVIVIRASGPTAKAFSSGDILRDSAQISLIAGDRLSVMTDGGTQILRGPYAGPVRAASTGEVRRFDFAALFKSRQRKRVAGIRGGD